MKFRYKVTISMITLVAVIFAIGGAGLIYVSFQNALDRELNLARKSYQMVANTFSIVGQTSTWTSTAEVTEAFGQIVDKNDFFEVVQLREEDKLLFTNNKSGQALELADIQPENGKVVNQVVEHNDRYYIQLLSGVEIGALNLYIDAWYDITDIYEQAREQGKIYRIIFLLVLLTSAAVSFMLSYILTKPISRLKSAAKSITDGNYEIRSDVSSNDEIGELSLEFNRMTDSLVDNMEQLNATLESQEMFIRNFTHELKTPMTSMIGYADLLRRQTLKGEEETDALNYIYSESRRLERLSIKMLELMVAGNEEAELAQLSPAELVAGVVNHYRPGFNEKGVELKMDCQSGECRLEADFFTSLIINLIENARRSMEEGEIIVKLEMTETGCILAVSDNGCGISEDKLAHITEAFYRVDKARSRSFGGAGLGLALCEKIAGLHKGSMQIDSELGKGTTVTVYLNGGRE